MTAEANLPAAVDLTAVNQQLAHATAEERIAWAHGAFGDRLVLSSSFGAQAAVMLGLAAIIVSGFVIVKYVV